MTETIKSYDGTPLRVIGDGVSALAAALVEFQSEMPVVEKSKTANVPTKTGGSYKYTYADLADVTAAALPLLGKHGLSFSVMPRQGDGGYEVAGRLLHVSGEYLEGALPLIGRSPQEIGSALTYARRYLLGSLTGIVTDDDVDGTVGPDAGRTRTTPPVDVTGAEVLDAAADLFAAIEATDDLEELRAIYTKFNVGSAPADVRSRFAARVDAVQKGAGK